MSHATAARAPGGNAAPPTPDGKLRRLPAGAIRSRVDPELSPSLLANLAPGARLDEIERRAGQEAGLRYLAWALPEREAVWWGCMCVLSLPKADAAEDRLIAAVRAWVRRPDEAGRAALLALVREAGAAGAAGHVGRAAFTSRTGDPDSLRAGFSVRGAVAAAVASLPPERRAEASARFRASALDISAGGAGWIEGARRE